MCSALSRKKNILSLLERPKFLREGTDVTIVANLLMVHKSLLAAKSLEAAGIEAEVIDVRTLVPFDWQTVFDSVGKTGRLVIVEEDNLTGGWGAEVAARVADSCIGFLQGPIKRLPLQTHRSRSRRSWRTTTFHR